MEALNSIMKSICYNVMDICWYRSEIGGTITNKLLLSARLQPKQIPEFWTSHQQQYKTEEGIVSELG